MSHASTIAAISSAPGAAPRALVRLSGPLARSITEGLCKHGGLSLELDARRSVRARLHDGAGEQPVIVQWMPAPASVTGEDVVEWHLCGSPPLVSAALHCALRAGAVLAQPGEFTRRAFENGRIDLTRAEGVLALVHARNEDERRAASSLLLGGLSGRVGELREQLDDLRALCEASLDFDEAETGGVPRADLLDRLGSLGESLERALAWECARESPLGLPRVVLAGRPNAGKSSLFNRLVAGTALVSDWEGTTRDALSATWATPGGDVELWDCAGTDGGGTGDSRTNLGAADQLARDRAHELLSAADLWLWTVDISSGLPDLGREFRAHSEVAQPPPTILILNKADALSPESLALTEADAAANLPLGIVAVVAASSTQGLGIESLSGAVARALAGDASQGEIRALSARHREALTAAAAKVGEASQLLGSGAALDLGAHALARATEELDSIQGRTTPEDLLSRIFARFCLGK